MVYGAVGYWTSKKNSLDKKHRTKDKTFLTLNDEECEEYVKYCPKNSCFQVGGLVVVKEGGRLPEAASVKADYLSTGVNSQMFQ